MSYESPEAMRAELAKVITNSNELDDLVAKYWKSAKKPRTGNYKPKPEHAPKGIKPKASDTPEMRIRNGTEALGAAIDAMLNGAKPKTQDELIWVTGLQPEKPEEYHNSEIRERERKTIAYQKALNAKVESLRVVAEGPCFKCGAARGCKHLTPTNVTQGRINRQWDKEAGRG